MTANQVKDVLQGIGLTEFTEVRVPKLNCIIMSQNFFVVPERDLFTFDFSNELIKIKQREVFKKSDGSEFIHDTSNNPYDFCFDMNNIVGFEFLSVRSRY